MIITLYSRVGALLFWLNMADFWSVSLELFLERKLCNWEECGDVQGGDWCCLQGRLKMFQSGHFWDIYGNFQDIFATFSRHFYHETYKTLWTGIWPPPMLAIVSIQLLLEEWTAPTLDLGDHGKIRLVCTTPPIRLSYMIY